MNLMIVEDELRLRNSLANNIPWEEHGIEVVGLAANGLEALHLIQRKKPDILLMDLQMPEMDGLTLIRKLHDTATIKIIILSGHDNFSFAQDALRFGVSKYLLKPAGDAEILDSVLEAADQLRKELERWHNEAMLQQKWSQHLPNLQNYFFQNWVNGKYDIEEITNRSKDLLIDLGENRQYAVAVVDIDPILEHESSHNTKDTPLLQFFINSFAKELLSHSSCWVCTDNLGYTLLIFAFPHEDNPNDAMLRVNSEVVKLLSHSKECLKLSASAGISGSTGGKEDVGKLYLQACKALLDRIIYGHDIAIPYREEYEKGEGLPIQPNLEKMLEIALQTEQENKALETLSVFLDNGVGKAESVDILHENVL
jgi:two-component system response regulator YesN